MIYLVHRICQSWTRGEVAHGLFLDVKAAFDKVWHSGLVSKLESVCVEGKALYTLQSYISNRKQVVVVDGVKSNVADVHAGIPQGSRLGPLLFILYIDDILQNLESECLIFADDTTLLATAKDSSLTSNMLNRDLVKIFEWSLTWKVTFNPSKSEDIIFTNKPLPHSSPVIDQTSPLTNWFPPLIYNHTTPLIFNNNTVKRVTIHKHLGVHLSSNLDWSVQIHHVCIKANRKLAVLRSVKNLKRGTLDVLYKLTVRSVLDYSLPVYYNHLKQSDIARLEQIQYKAAKLVTGALHYTSKDKLNAELGWESIQDRSQILGLSIFHKIHLGLTRPLITTLKPELVIKTVNTRQKASYKPFPYTQSKMHKSFFPHFTRSWLGLKSSVQEIQDIDDFKAQLKLHLKPARHKHYTKGSKLGNKLLTHLRLGRSYLHDHSFTLGLSDTTACDCSSPHESVTHYLLDCPLYSGDRLTLFGQVAHLIPKFQTFTKKRKAEILLHGFQPNIPDYYHTNISLQYHVQNFVLKTKRFLP